MNKQSSQSHTQNQVILYTAADGKVMANVLFANDTFWLTQSVMSELFGVKIPAISKHLKNIYESKELSPEATVSKMEIVQIEGERQVTREVEVYNLDAAIAVGYRVNSIKATHFRIWATNTLREFIVKGSVRSNFLLSLNINWIILTVMGSFNLPNLNIFKSPWGGNTKPVLSRSVSLPQSKILNASNRPHFLISFCFSNSC